MLLVQKRRKCKRKEESAVGDVRSTKNTSKHFSQYFQFKKKSLPKIFLYRLSNFGDLRICLACTNHRRTCSKCDKNWSNFGQLIETKKENRQTFSRFFLKKEKGTVNFFRISPSMHLISILLSYFFQVNRIFSIR